MRLHIVLAVPIASISFPYHPDKSTQNFFTYLSDNYITNLLHTLSNLAGRNVYSRKIFHVYFWCTPDSVVAGIRARYSL